MTWGTIAKAAVALAVDFARDWVRERREQECPSCGWTYRDVKRANDAAHAAGHEKDAKRNTQR